MQIIKNTLKPVIERWDDPGEYPSGAGGYPLPSHNFVESVNGYITVEFSMEELEDIVREYLDDQEINHEVAGLKVMKWEIRPLTQPVVRLEVLEFDMDAPEKERD